MVKTTGPCSVCPVALANGSIPEGAGCAVPENSPYIILIANGAGLCHVELTFASGATSSVDLDFMSVPQGCGNEGFLPVAADGSPCAACGQVSIPNPTCDAGLDARASAVADATMDAPSEAAVDAEVEAGTDAVADARTDARSEAAVDAMDAVADADRGCTPQTCAALKYDCGPISDGCGNVIQCGTCTSPDYCGGGGYSKCGGEGNPTQCPVDVCPPATCDDYDCGLAADGCGGLLDCGSCPFAEACSENQCVWPADAGSCVPATCEGLVYDCGSVSDGCGGHMECGTCPDSQFCGGGGVHRCGGTCETPDGGNPCWVTCSSADGDTCGGLSCLGSGAPCGEAPNGCGGLIDCGPCGGDSGAADAQADAGADR